MNSWDQLQLFEAQNNNMSITIETGINNFLAELFPTLCHTAKRYLLALSISLPSRCLFNTAGNTYTKTKSCINVDNME
ncbi:hypothetical protein ACJMK2_039467 [Sinanodonta woodiana]|uniref:Uncharacterized protein n=1 Tax=Sinanodonta woodiana TaxID=1069815 RepID=A0ABD3WCZ4_SINWO